MIGHPCLNPNCRSEGRPHPNCRCYGMAEGGDVRSGCLKNDPHNEDCEYFADGGEVPASDLPSTSEEVPASDLPAQANPQASEEVPASDLPSDSSQISDFEKTQPDDHTTTGQQVLTGVEGAAKGVLGPVATGLELGAHKLGLDDALGVDTSAEAQKARAEQNPTIHHVGEAAGTVGSFFIPIGEGKLLVQAAEHLAPEAFSVLGKLGTQAFKGFVESAGMQGGDEISKALLGDSDPETPVSSAIAHMGVAGLFGSAVGGISSGLGQGVGKGLKVVEDSNIANRAKSFLAGMGEAAANEGNTEAGPIASFGKKYNQIKALKALNIPELDPKSFQSGKDFYPGMAGKVLNKLTEGAVTGLGGYVGGIPGGSAGYSVAHTVIAPYVEKVLGKSVRGANKYLVSGLMKAMSTGETAGIGKTLNYVSHVGKGEKLVTDGIQHLFEPGVQQAYDSSTSDSDRQKIKDMMDDNIVDKQIQNSAQPEEQAYAEGGDVSNDVQSNASGLATHMPAQNMVLASAKNRVYNYLKGMKPQPKPGLSYDEEHKDPRQDEKYDNAIDIANKPLKVLQHIKDGTLLPEHVKHLTSLYPEVHTQLSKRLTEEISKQQLAKKSPDYKTKMGLSLLLGTPLDSSMTPAAILAAQPQPSANQGQSGKVKGGKATTNSMLKTTKAYQTPNQAAEDDKSSRD